MKRSRPFAALVAAPLLSLFAAPTARAADPTPLGAPPPDAKALVSAPTSAAAAAPKIETPTDDTTATVSAGGQLSTGNSQLFAATANGKVELRRGANGFGASVLGNYGQGATGPNQPTNTTAENLQARLRYDRYLIERLSIFAIVTGRHDRFQGLDFRFNLDPGVKYLFVNEDATSFWGEVGYDFQYDIRRDDALNPTDATGAPLYPTPLAKTATDNSTRLFVGFKHAFNKAVTFTTGLEYLQSLVVSKQARVNYDALFAAAVGGGFSAGIGYSLRYDNAPLPGKVNTDTATTFNLIYSYSDIPDKAPTCPCPEPAPPPPPPADAAPPAAPPAPAAPPTPAAPPAPTAPGATPAATPTPAPAAPPPNP